jgi:hypothetical protein
LHSCRPVALWFYILVFDHNATDPNAKKWLQFTAKDFLCALGKYLSTFQYWSIKTYWFEIYVYYFNTKLYIYPPPNTSQPSQQTNKPINSLVLIFLPVGPHDCRMSSNSKQAILLVCRDVCIKYTVWY